MMRTGVSSGPTGPGSGCGNGSGVGCGSGAGAVIGCPCRISPARLQESGLTLGQRRHSPRNRCPSRSNRHRHDAQRRWKHEPDEGHVDLSRDAEHMHPERGQRHHNDKTRQPSRRGFTAPGPQVDGQQDRESQPKRIEQQDVFVRVRKDMTGGSRSPTRFSRTRTAWPRRSSSAVTSSPTNHRPSFLATTSSTGMRTKTGWRKTSR